MSIELSFETPHKSIKNFENVSVPNFTIITGVNGSGKTHLLNAIQNKNILTKGITDKEKIRYFNWESFAPQLDDSSSPFEVRKRRETALDSITSQLDSRRKNLLTHLAKFEQTTPKLLDLNFTLTATSDSLLGEIRKGLAEPEKNDDIRSTQLLTELLRHKKNEENGCYQNIKQYGNLEAKLRKLTELRNCSVLVFSRQDIDKNLQVFWGNRKILQLKLADWFSAWHAEFEYNRLNRYYSEKFGEKDRPWLTDEDFRKRFGPEPWILSNKVLETSGIRHRFNRPQHKIDSLNNTFQLFLSDPDTGAQIPAGDMSSGEKIILAITLLLYQTTEDAVISELPKLLLLDEVDAPLHPTFVRALMDVLKEDIVGNCGVPVIMTTHSPSTVALAPAESVHELVRGPTHKLRPITASIATQKLSEGFITLSRNDVMVITESGADVGYYENVYAALVRNGKVKSHPKLTFIPASKSRKKNGDGGCTQVRNWAPKLSDLGIARFRGLVDRDAGASVDTVVSVLKRYSWENYLFDPLTLLGFLLSKGVSIPTTDGFVYPKSSADFLSRPQDEIQPCIDAFVRWIGSSIGDTAFDDATRVEVSYEQWSKLTIPKWFMDTNGHELDTALMAVLNPLTSAPILKKDQYTDLIHYQANEASGLISSDFIDIFCSLQSSEDSSEEEAFEMGGGEE